MDGSWLLIEIKGEETTYTNCNISNSYKMLALFKITIKWHKIAPEEVQIKY